VSSSIHLLPYRRLAIDDLQNRVAVNIGKPHVSAFIEVGRPGVVDAEQIKNRGVQVVHGNRLPLGLVTELIAGANEPTHPQYARPLSSRGVRSCAVRTGRHTVPVTIVKPDLFTSIARRWASRLFGPSEARRISASR
jgi:hypothetical protein